MNEKTLRFWYTAKYAATNAPSGQEQKTGTPPAAKQKTSNETAIALAEANTRIKSKFAYKLFAFIARPFMKEKFLITLNTNPTKYFTTARHPLAKCFRSFLIR